jgi:hypothetical protein
MQFFEELFWKLYSNMDYVFLVLLKNTLYHEMSKLVGYYLCWCSSIGGKIWPSQM